MEKKKNNKVFYISIVIVVLTVLWALLFPTNFGAKANSALDFLVAKFGWFYLTTLNLFIVFCIWLASSKYGKIKLGPDDSKPQYSYISWFAMLFSAGMGIGLVFWGVAEPLNHFVNPIGAQGGTEAAKSFAITKSFMHWGLHPWANYSVLALALAYMQFRRNKPSLISSIFIPLIGEDRSKGTIGKAVDVLAIFATVTGVATSLGLGTLQINSGLNYLFGVPQNSWVQLVIVVVVTILFMLSAATGLNKGIKILSNTNIIIAGILLALAIIIGPTLDIFNSLGKGILTYTKDLFVEINPFGKGNWYKDWTIFYWAWWIAWAPFVGTFIARISKGRTIREFVIGVLLVPATLSFIWFAAFGTLGMDAGLEVANKAITTTETALFVVMEYQPLGAIISFVAIILLGTFFVTSADSATFVLGMMSSNGRLRPSTARKLTWGVIQSALALALMVAGGLKMLQTASIVVAFPFAIVMIFAMISMIKALKQEKI
ncbi:BCCT family transporter [Sporosalibacterium faouarense]|uniref:BCCT family transporter n=1 Tax=Sporosalibacterium faouarense TaxID=516123 RepID=UPI00192C5C75|nr:BCCT family transporter [Sporosalibacterium faouarense]